MARRGRKASAQRGRQAIARRGRRAAALALLGALLWAQGAAADEPPAGATWAEATIASSDGTRLHADVFRPAGAQQPLPVMLVVSPYLDPPPDEPGPTVLRWYRALYERAIAHGHAVVQVSLRGTGASEGCSDFGGPGEQADARAAVEWAASQPWSTGRVGMLGHSYDGYAAIAALAQRPPALRAVVVAAPAVSLYRGAFMNGVAYLQTPGVAAYYQALSVGGLGAPASRDPACSAATIGEARNPDPKSAFWRERDLTKRAAGTNVPVLWSHGFLDGRDDFSAVRPDNFLDLWQRLEGPRRGWFGQFPHVVPSEHNTWNEPEPVGRDDFVAEAVEWLDAHVAGSPEARARAQARPPVLVQDGAGRWRGETAWPPGNAGSAALELRPGAYSDDPGTKAEQGDDPGGGCADGVKARCNPASRTGRGSWTFSRPLTAATRLAGTVRLEATLRTQAPDARVVALVYDVSPEHRAALLTRGATLIPGEGRVAFDLYPQDWELAPGHRIGVLLAGSDDFYFEGGRSGARVDLESGRLVLPLAPAAGRPVEGGPSRAVSERTTFPVDPALTEERANELTPARPSRANTAPRAPRLTRTCLHGGALRVAVRHPAAGTRRVVFRFGGRRVAADGRAPFVTVVGRRMLARTHARRLRATLAPGRTALVRSLPRCGLRSAR
jgi:hypothetical protein